MNSAADDGSVVITYFSDFFNPKEKESVKDKIITVFNEPVRAIALEEVSTGSRERSFLIGTLSGQLIRHHTAWFSQKNSILYKGDGTSVTVIKTCGNLVAWADLFYVRILGNKTYQFYLPKHF